MADDDRDQDKAFDLKSGATDSGAVSDYYDDWAKSYDETLKSWNYTAPMDAADLIAGHLRPGARILDVGCGTGLFSIAMRMAGDFRIHGIDISEESLKLAEENGAYQRLMGVDLQDVPLPIKDNSMDAAASVGVLTYIEDSAALLRDLCRIVKSGGVITFTQRTDRWEQLEFGKTVEVIEQEGLWTILEITDPKDYLPGNADFGEDIRVIHTLCRVN
ncbi:class I SAM-dependent DNA methyltransferase [Salipiger mucosus]|uniref:Williams-Beuren syndrome chromosome region 27 n=1 Tax=Salipiger mucosus DSM 16094 TaxID=1123237 RepID=S9QW86_9RHOB|nr:class I SAM-dependent methyltransferase [Salipiger mucosus]EPX83862.1 Williams-Beuren syndrome chromosome region 27 [Salipiger mucosus DSM 16094]